MSQMYRVALCSGVAMAALALSAPSASAQMNVTQSTNNSAAVSNPASGTNTIDLGGGGLGAGASVSTSAGGAVSSTSITGINTHFVNPANGFGTVIQGAVNQTTAPITNTGAIINASGDAALGSSLGIGARGAASTLSVIGMGGIPFQVVNPVGDIGQGVLPGGPGPVLGALAVINDALVANTGEITGPSGGPALNLSGTGASASVSATGALSAVSWTALDATGFTSTFFNNIQQAPQNSNTGGPGGVSNILSANGISLGAISGDSASVSATATGAAAATSFSYINTANWQGLTLNSIIQQPTNNAPVTNNANTGVSVGTISGDGASVRIGAAGASAGVSFASIGSTFTGAPPSVTVNGGFFQTVVNNGAVSNGGTITSSGTSGLTGVGSSAVVSGVGGSAAFSWSSIGDSLTAPLVGSIIGFAPPVSQTVNNTGSVASGGAITLGTGNLANGAVASLSATGAQASVSVSAINTTTFTSPFLGNINQTVTNSIGPNSVTNSMTSLTTGNLTGHGSSVSATATGAAASIGVSYVNTTAWSTMPIISAFQTVSNTGIINNLALTNPISVGDISGTGASVRASATGAAASIALTSIVSGAPNNVPPNQGLIIGGSIVQLVTNAGLVRNEASIVSTGTLSGMASSAVISATGAAASVSVASINDTQVTPFTVSTGPINQTVTNNPGSVTNLGSITLGGGNLGAGAVASISAVGASASVSFLAIR
jgi:fibronectin-binding autotransporter adhesin